MKSIKEIQAPLPTRISSTELKSIDAFVHNGFSNWKKSLERFAIHEKSGIHKSCFLTVNHVKIGTNVSKCLNNAKYEEMVSARKSLIAIITSLRFLAQQGLAIRGHNDESSNIRQLLLFWANDNADLQCWLNRTKYVALP